MSARARSRPAPSDRSVEVALAEALWVSADPIRLEQVLVNLLTNAYRYGGRQVRVEAVRRREGGVLATVSDDGPGVRGELVALLFEKFSWERMTGTAPDSGSRSCAD